ncbi:hypothetical protein MPTK1_3g00310 [Marchantia polymorpha subsp. ruderalis]|uniref:Uncharacterized protein n=2 Tax=Marchantia polymorpha TaxID=3197 RepID=A0AAF6AVV0_MARPO|nr:hypothetical protein MARPO_0007s0028 [Marchantia polymorpha]BBN03884.1 hypothetical protein Mp_3g00310 [Marchantia polymorpha subsp. ruderalis]|eukprot:PTQ47573.1 hypothetical protein MARPO_0007s0028 [Marchantia polymorpha]
MPRLHMAMVVSVRLAQSFFRIHTFTESRFHFPTKTFMCHVVYRQAGKGVQTGITAHPLGQSRSKRSKREKGQERKQSSLSTKARTRSAALLVSPLLSTTSPTATVRCVLDTFPLEAMAVWIDTLPRIPYHVNAMRDAEGRHFFSQRPKAEVAGLAALPRSALVLS